MNITIIDWVSLICRPFHQNVSTNNSPELSTNGIYYTVYKHSAGIYSNGDIFEEAIEEIRFLRTSEMEEVEVVNKVAFNFDKFIINDGDSSFHIDDASKASECYLGGPKTSWEEEGSQTKDKEDRRPF